ncbi:MAG: glycosyltransferase family 2 protein [bacterium]
MHPNISVIIPTYNRRKMVCEAIESVFNQTENDFEIIVVDDGSTDNTNEEIKRFGDNLTYIHQEHTGSIARTRNEGIKIAKGNYIALLDSDDIWLPEKLQRQIQHFQNPNVTFCYSNVLLLTETGPEPPMPPLTLPTGRILKSLLHGTFILPSTVMLKRACLKSTGLFDETLGSVEDYLLWLRLAWLGEVACVTQPMVLMRRHQDHHSLKFEELNNINAIKALKIFAQTTPLSWQDRIASHRCAFRFQLRCAKRYLDWQQPGKAWKYLLYATLKYPLHAPLWQLWFKSFKLLRKRV